MEKQLVNGRITEDDWKVLFPGKTHMLGGHIPLYIEPAGLAKIQKLSTRALEVTAVLEGAEISFQELFEPEKLALALPIIVQHVPEVVADLSGIHVDDVRRLPLTALLPLAMDIIEVNMGSLEYLQKNLQSLAMVLVAVRNMGLGT